MKLLDWFAFGAEDDDEGDKGQGPDDDGADDADDDSDDDDSQEGATAKEKKLAAEAAKHRKGKAEERRKRVEAEKRLKEREDAEKDELTRLKEANADLTKQVEALTTSNTELRLQNSVQREATKSGFADPDDAWKLLDRDALEVDDEGVPQNTGDVLKSLLEARPYLAGTEGDGKVATSETSTTRPNGRRHQKLTQADLAKMTPEQVAAISDTDFLSIMTPTT